MKYLLDTHTFLWYFLGSKKISVDVKEIIDNKDLGIYISAASLWEFSIKHSMDTLQFDGGLENLYNLINEADITILPITQKYLQGLYNLSYIHRDPFDRLLIATANAENMTILTADANIHKYSVLTKW